MPQAEDSRPGRPSSAGINGIAPYVIALVLLPVLVLWRHDDPLYTPLWQSDPWFYLGYFRNLVNFKRDLFPDFYYGSRLSWILPGYLVHRLFSPLVANAVLHLGVHSVGVLSLFATLRRTIGIRTAYLTAMMFSLYPWLWANTGWDHVNGGVIAYYLLAMALLTHAAVRPVRKGTLFLAGMAIAGSAHAHLFLVALSPLLVLHYLGLTWTWHRTAVTRSFAALCAWAGTGFIAFTAPICVINYLLIDGNPWFWTPSLHTAQTVTQKYVWTESLWYEQMLVPYLWFILVAAVVAILLLAFRWKRDSREKSTAGLIFSVQLLLATALMVFLQFRGITLLGHYYYACYLFPFAFLVLGASLLPAVEGMNPRVWAVTCCAATLLFGLPWIEPPANPVLARLMTEGGAFVLAGCFLTLALLLRRRHSGAWLALCGLAILTSLTYTGSFRWLPLHAKRQEYTRVMGARRRIEELRADAPIRFWYDKSEPAFFEYYALNASYMAEFARIGESFPQGCVSGVDSGTMVVVSSGKEHAPELALHALTECWRGTGVKPMLQGVQNIAMPDQPYQIVMLKAVDDFSLQTALGVTFDATGTGQLHAVENATQPVPLPLSRWTASAGTSIRSDAGELTVRTPQAGTAYALSYAPLVMPATGKYRFQLNYTAQDGRIAFGAFPADPSRWLGSDIFGHRTATGRGMVFTLDLNAGETVILRIANNNTRDVPADFVIRSVSVTAVPGPR